MAVNKTMIDKAMLKVKSTSSITAGNGTSIMIKTSKTRTGIAPWAEGLGSLAVSIPKIFINNRYESLNYANKTPQKTKKVLNLPINAKFALNIPI